MPPLLHLLPPETAHHVAITALKYGLVPNFRRILTDTPVHAFGIQFPNALGMAAGFDKNGEALQGLAKLGFGFIEVGTVTPKPQLGNAKPRLFRLSQDKAIINRLGFNNHGHQIVQKRLDHVPAWVRQQCRIGVNIGKNKDTEDAASDYVAGIKAFRNLADYLTLNISSPNTPNLRALQQVEHLRPLLEACANEAATHKTPPMLLKIAPDIDREMLAAIIETCIVYGFSGLIISNTTIGRSAGLQSPLARETGGLSGVPLFASSTALLKEAHALAAGKLSLVGVGGILSAQDANTKRSAGATLVQLYTGLIYGGIRLPAEIVRGMT